MCLLYMLCEFDHVFTMHLFLFPSVFCNFLSLFIVLIDVSYDLRSSVSAESRKNKSLVLILTAFR